MKGDLDISRRKTLMLMGGAGAMAAGTGLASAHRQDVDPRKLRELRDATRRYRDLDEALADGYILPEEHCVSHPERDAAMGFHYVHPGKIDDRLDHTDPEVLLYEERGNKRHLVAVEFLSTAPADGDPPTVLGHELHPFEQPFANWALHAWIWKGNPDGLFADFNPNVRCP